MPEIKRVFTSGRMNKDLDERLVPNGEYRDALNVQLATSEGSNVGTLQNVLGNEKLSNIKSVLISGISGITSSTEITTVGSAVDETNNKVYFFITANDSDNYSAIIEYDQDNNSVLPVIVDVDSEVLNFNNDTFITGINIFDGFIYYTDNINEPKQIDIDKFKNGANTSNPYTTTTQYDGRDFKEEDITIIKKSPFKAPHITLQRSLRDGQVNTVFKDGGSQFKQASEVDLSSTTQLVPGDSVSITFDGRPSYSGNDIIKLTSGEQDEHVVRVRLFNISSQGTSFIRFNTKIVSITDDILGTGDDTWQCILEEPEPLYEFKFPRFAYRWKYDNNQFSAISPFTDVAFLPDEVDGFKYDSIKGHNKAMTNNARKIKINSLLTPPSDVAEVQILYKESNSTNIYILSKLTKDETSFEITSEQIQGLLDSNQILRIYDNVPLKAKSQDVVGSRLVYGNYTQNFDVPQTITIDSNVFSKEIKSPVPAQSLKSQRKYQLGVVYIDEYGRQTPVFTSDSSSKGDVVETSEVKVDIFGAETANQLQVKVNSTHPSWAKYFKYYVKENSNEYYNLALDRYYYGEDNFLWLSFNSPERNKIEIGDYITLKKAHGKDVAAATLGLEPETLKYKILDIQTIPPKFVKTEKQLFGSIAHVMFSNDADGSYVPAEDIKVFRLDGNDIHESSNIGNLKDLAGGTQDGLYVKIFNDKTNVSTRTYEIDKITLIDNVGGTGDGAFDNANDRYEFSLKEPFGTDANFIPDPSLGSYSSFENGNITVEFYQSVEKEERDFAGKFFVKVQKNSNLEFSKKTNISQKNFIQVAQKKLVLIDGSDYLAGQASWVVQDVQHKANFGLDIGGFRKSATRGGTAFIQTNDYTNLKGKSVVYIRHFDSTDFYPIAGNTGTAAARSGKLLHDKLTGSTTKYLQFSDNDDTTSDDAAAIYEIKTVKHFEIFNYTGGKNKWSSKRGYMYEITLKQPVTWDPVTDGNMSVNSAGGVRMPIISDRWNDNQIYLNILEEDTSNEGENEINPAIFETEPKAQEVDLNIWHEASSAYPVVGIQNYIHVNDIITGFSSVPAAQRTVTAIGIDGNNNRIQVSGAFSASTGDILTFTNPQSGAAVTATVASVQAGNKITFSVGGSFPNHNQTQTLSWFNCFAFGNGVESNRIRDDFNAVVIDKGPKVSAVLSTPYGEETLKNGLIYSGIYNSNASVNELNQFNAGIKITKDLNPEYGSIQKLHTRNTDLIAFCEDKVIKILANKDALFNADGNINLTSTNNVLGQSIPFVGEYGISKNPESFANHGYRVYFADKKRGAVLRLSMDGITEISEKGMRDYFLDNTKAASSIIGSYDISTDSYNITLNDDTVSFTELVNGWVSRKSFIPENGVSLNNTYYTFYDGEIWSHTNALRNKFYDATNKSSVNLIFNDVPSSIKNFKTLNYEGSKDWKATEVTTDQQSGKVTYFKDKENKWFNYIRGTSTSKVTINFVDNNNSNFEDVEGIVLNKAVDSTVNDSVTFTVKPKNGFKVDNPSNFAYQGPVSKVTSVTNVANVNGNIQFTVNLNGFTMPSSDVIINVPFNTSNTLVGKTYSINVNTFNVLSNATASSSGAFTTSGTYGSTSTLYTNTITPTSNNTFSVPPSVDKTGLENPSNYDITRTGPDGNGAYAFVVKYKFPNKNVTGDVLTFNATAGSSIIQTTNKIYNAVVLSDGVEDQSTLNAAGETRTIRIFGDNGAQVSVNAYNNASPSTSLIGGATTKTIQSEGFVDVDINFPAIANTARTYSIKLQEINSGDFVNDFDASQTGGDGIVIFTLNQFTDTVVTFGINNAPANMTIITSADPYFSTFTSTGPGNTEIDIPLDILLSFKVTATQNISLKEFNPYYQHFTRKANTTATTTGGSVTNTTFTIASANANILPGMVVTGTGISGYVYVESISGTTLVLSESVTLNNATLTFSGVDTTKQQLILEGGSIVKFGRSTVTIDNSGGTKSAIFTIPAYVVKYGTSNVTTNLDLNTVFNVGSGITTRTVTVAPSSTSNNLISSISLDSGNTVNVGTAAGTVITGTGTMVGNFNNLTSSQIDLSYDTLVGFNDSTGSSTSPTYTPDPAATGSSTQSATFNWSMRLSSNVGTSTNLSFKVYATDTPE